MVPSYGPFETKQLLFEKFFAPGLDFRDIRLDGLKWSNLYIQGVTKQTFVCKMSYSRFNSKTIFPLSQFYPMLIF